MLRNNCVGNWEGASIILKQILEYDVENPDAKQLLDEVESNHFWSRMENVFYLLMALIAASATVWWLYQKREQLGSMFSNNNDEPLNLKTFPNVNLKGDADIPPNPR